ncbi:MAG: NifB/NifX family molybdenum-iron cluster-binding protein [Desulfobulbus sp.]
MNIAVTASDPSLDSIIFEEFSQTPYLLIVNVETMECTSIKHVVSLGSDTALARSILEYRCEAVITGKLPEAAFDIIADDGVTRFFAENMSVKEALDAMDRRKLGLIRNPQGTDNCSGEHHH